MAEKKVLRIGLIGGGFMGCATAAFLLAFVAPGWNTLALLPAAAVRIRSKD